MHNNHSLLDPQPRLSFDPRVTLNPIDVRRTDSILIVFHSADYFLLLTMVGCRLPVMLPGVKLPTFNRLLVYCLATVI